VMENLEHFKHDYESNDNGSVNIVGLDQHKSLSDHHLSSRKKNKS